MKKKSVIILVAVFALAILAICIFSNAGDNADKIKDGETGVISTPYADLKVTSDFYNNTTHKVESKDPYTLSFKANDGTKLFTLYFGKETSQIVGTLKRDDGNVVICLNMETIGKSNKNYEKNCAYQEEINSIIEHLQEDYDFVPYAIADGATLDEAPVDETSTFVIKTSVVNLQYPERWKDKVKVAVKGDTVKFADGETPLFDIVFKKVKDGYLLGNYKETPVYVVYYPVEGLKHQEMVEDVNVILQNLMEDENFTVHIGQ